MARFSIDYFLEICMKEMFMRVGLIYPNTEFTSDPNWYEKRSWTQSEEDGFRHWMFKFLYTNLKRKGYRKKDVELQVEFFLLQWGWTTKRDYLIKTIIQ